ncbi:MAG: thioether cross-link-forming SCIFF peptide maturase [Oscillospiraceae bacterium]|nr:thioether cross-link-forming SCIFF peptide maturase [Oscillospiraceae bacterium]
MLDINSGAIHSVDSVTYDVISMYTLILDGKDKDVLISHVIEKHKNTTRDDIMKIITDVENLVNSGGLYSPDVFAHIAESKKAFNLKALCLNVSHVCNMSCEYCFAIPTSSTSSTNPIDLTSHNSSNNLTTPANPSNPTYPTNPTSPTTLANPTDPTTLMTLEIAKKAINFLVENSGKINTLDIDFFGGEPLLNWSVVKETVMYAREIERKIGKKFRFTLTTNGLLIDDDVIDFCNKEMHNVVLSLDGREDTHNKMRKLPSGSGSYETVVDKITRFVETRRGKGYYIRGTYTQENKDFVNDILHIADLGFKEISLEPAVKGKVENGKSHTFSLADLPEIFHQYETLTIEMQRRESLNRGFNFYHYNLDLENGPCVHKRIAGCGVGTEYMAVAPNGDLYPCHQFIDDKRFLLGNVFSGVNNLYLREEFGRMNIYTKDECKDCWARFYCSGGCAANAYYSSGSIYKVDEIGCELFKKRMECAIMMKYTLQPRPFHL